MWLFRAFSNGNRDNESRIYGLKAAKEIGLLAILFIGSFICVNAISFKDSGSFEKDPGSGDYWRVPLSYPYQLTIIDGLDQAACLSKWDPNNSMMSCELSGITEIVSMGKVVAGKASGGIFIFDQANGGLIRIEKIDSLKVMLAKLGIHELGEMKTTRKYYEEYWNTH